MLISTLVLKENLLDKSQNRPPKNTGPVIHCWHSTLSSCTSLVSSLPLSHSTLPSTAPESSKPHLKSKSCCNISLYTSVSTKKKNPLHSGPLPDGHATSCTMVTLFFVAVHNCSYGTECYYHYLGALSYFLEKLIICFLLFMLILR